MSSVSQGREARFGEIPYTDAGEEPRAVRADAIRAWAESARDPRPKRWLAAGLVLLLLALGLTAIAAGEGTVPGDVAVGRFLQRLPSPQLDAAAQVISAVGDEYPAMALMAGFGAALLVARGRRNLALFLVLAAALRALGPVLKVLINSPRPTVEAVVIVAQAEGLGFPSGHAFGAALFYGALAVILPRVVGDALRARTLQAACLAAMLLISWSRIRLGVHWPSDAAGGLLYGIGLICLLQAAFLAWGQRVRT